MNKKVLVVVLGCFVLSLAVLGFQNIEKDIKIIDNETYIINNCNTPTFPTIEETIKFYENSECFPNEYTLFIKEKLNLELKTIND